MEREKYSLLLEQDLRRMRWVGKRDRMRERAVRRFLLKYCDSISFTHMIFRMRDKKPMYTRRDPLFLRTLGFLKDDIIKTKRYPTSWLKPKFTTFYYLRLSKKIKGIINRKKLSSGKSFFYGLGEPIYFYKKDKLIANIIRHEDFMLLHLTQDQREALAEEGLSVYFYHPYICHSCGKQMFDLSGMSTDKKGRSKEYCKDCYVKGKFAEPDLTINKILRRNFEPEEARCHKELGNLKRWNPTWKPSKEKAPLKWKSSEYYLV